MTVVDVRRVRKRHGAVDLCVGPGEVHGLTGPNGATSSYAFDGCL